MMMKSEGIRSTGGNRHVDVREHFSIKKIGAEYTR